MAAGMYHDNFYTGNSNAITYGYVPVTVPTFSGSASTAIQVIPTDQFVQQETPDDWDFARNRKMTPLEYLDKRVDEVCRLAFAA